MQETSADNTIDMDQMPYVHRDLSWLSFNYRVLQEAKDPQVPLLERIKFLAIYSSNLDEFFRVRVANHRNILRAGPKAIAKLGYDPESLMTELRFTLNEQLEEFSRIFQDEIIPALKAEKIYLRKPEDLNREKREFIEKYFQDNCLPYVQPVLLLKDKIRPFLTNAALYLALQLTDLQRPEDDNRRYAIVKVPSDHLPRFVTLPSGFNKNHVIFLDDLVRHNIPQLFPGYKVEASYSIKLTRDAELYIDDEYSGDLVEKIKKGIHKRQVGLASRLVYDREMPEEMLQFLIEQFDLDELDCVAEGRYHNNFDFFGFPSFGKSHLINHELEPLDANYFEGDRAFEKIQERDRLFMFPFHSYDPVVDFFQQAMVDPAVTHIKIMQYRIGRVSRILSALMKAVKLGKRVTVFIEIKARFDEEENLKWAEKLEEAGINVIYSFPGLKVHSKLAIVRRIEEGKAVNYAYLSTGNFNEKTATLYSDFGLFTCDPRISSEVMRLFTFLETKKKPSNRFVHLLVGHFNLTPQLLSLIDFEIAEAKAGRPAFIHAKMNSVEDKPTIAKLYEASQAGVKIELIVRGICSLRAGVPGVSENIKVISILDRYLEHARLYWFHAAGEDKIYLSSADFMKRNLTRRIEAAYPIYDEQLKDIVKTIFRIQWTDNVKARHIGTDNENDYQRTDNELAVQSQLDTYYFFKRISEAGVESVMD